MKESVRGARRDGVLGGGGVCWHRGRMNGMAGAQRKNEKGREGNKLFKEYEEGSECFLVVSGLA